MTTSDPLRAADLFDLSGRVAVVTGASSGLGRRFALVLAANGAKVACLARRKARLDELVREIEASGGTALAIEADVTDTDAMTRAFDTVERQLGPVAIVVNNAGIANDASPPGTIEPLWQQVIDVNLSAVYRCAELAAGRMLASGTRGSIVNIASIAGLFAHEATPISYTASKAGVIQLTRGHAVKLAASGIRVNAIAPGYFPSEMTVDYLASSEGQAEIANIPMGRAGSSGGLDGALLLLTSDAGRDMTGAVIVVDGAHSIAAR